MAEEILPVEEPTEQNATVETTEEIDYGAELEKAEASAEEKRLAYATRHARKEVEEGTQENDSQSIADEVVRRVLPVLNSATQSNLIEQKLDDLSGGNDALKRLIKFHMENTVSSSLDLNDRAEAAYAIANKKVIEKQVKEINTATRNRSQISNSGLGMNQENLQRPGDNVVSEEQKKELKKRAEQYGNAAGWTEKQKTDFVTKAIERLARPR